MTDLSTLTDAQIKELYAKQKVATKSVDQMSDDELRAAAGYAPKGMIVINSQTDWTKSNGDGTFSPIGAEERKQIEQDNEARRLEYKARKDRETDGSLTDHMGAVSRGIPFIGPFTDHAAAGLAHLIYGTDYDKALAYGQARSKTFDEDHPIASTVEQIGGTAAGTIAAAPLAGEGMLGYLFGTGAKTPVNSVMRGASAGALQGATAGAGESDDLSDWKKTGAKALNGGAFGMAFGAGIPAVVGGAAKVFQALTHRGGDMLSSVPKKAREWLISQMSPEQIRAMSDDMAKLGPEAIPADVNQTLLGVAQGASSMPSSRQTVIDALTSRDLGKNARLNNVINNEIGATPRVPSEVADEITSTLQSIGPRYTEALKDAGPVEIQPIISKITKMLPTVRGKAASKLESVRGYLYVPGTGVVERSPKALLAARNAIDGMFDGEEDRNVIRVLTEIRKDIDAELTTKVPGIKAIDSEYMDTARQGEAFDAGRRVLDTGREAPTPTDVAKTMTEGGLPPGTMVGPSGVPFRLREGARAEIERIVGTNANDVAKLRNVMKGEGDWNRQKLASIFGEDKAKKILDVIDAETVFENTNKSVVNGSQTDVKKGFRELLSSASEGLPKVNPGTTMTGGMLRVGQAALNKVAEGRGKKNAARFAQELARLSVAKGSERDALINALLDRAKMKSNIGMFAGQGAAVSAPVNTVIQALLSRSSQNGEQRQ